MTNRGAAVIRSSCPAPSTRTSSRMRIPPLRRTVTMLGIAALTGPLAGCAGGMASLAAGLDQAAGTQYYDFSEADDQRAYCDNGSTYIGFVRLYHGIASNHRDLYAYNATTVPVDMSITWSDGTVTEERISPRTYSSRTDRWATITARTGMTIRCSLR